MRLPDDATIRTSVATATVGLDHPLPLPEQLEDLCGKETVDAMDNLRDSLNDVSRAFVSALDDLIFEQTGNSNSNGDLRTTQPQPLLRDSHGQKTYSTLSSIVASANHLEHFHVYTKDSAGDRGNDSVVRPPTAAWDWHTDAGLFLVFVPAWNCQENQGEDSSFWYQDAEGNPVQARLDGPKTAVVMLGQ
ncbi:MAG: hypothetical protein SGARI_004889, partial [Bacillariaceae sp.]